ncbi:MAG: hypothetical protein A2W98_04845 [Bacteroidetes bacterium GWF2_33_38]|nr:MAG: hypothetical protein A2W98_04845 [Bacteroidetes bacterium GWF2_33_38]OFY76146.1 MAG: hypothetical protein A2265_07690 [Bacteroidetes bacterium RIFOXYA12_FULL_33_9]OFY90742.1 MAG: hypothetical protein A2236_05545 [Bacteroidetes bacterium RIFOXYA2_FULL_33_7]
MKKTLIVAILLTCTVIAKAIKDSAMVVPMFSGGIAFQIPKGDIAKRFGFNNSTGASFTLKTRNNFLLGADFEFIFGNNLNDTSIFQNILTSNGYLINTYGEYAKVVLSERGLYIGGSIGKQFPILAPNPNSGPFFTLGAGLLQYKTRIENDGNNTPYILDEYKKGYDKLTNGLCFKEFIGYRYLGNKQAVNFYFGMEFYQAWTQNRRSIDFDTMTKDISVKEDYLYSFRFGWIIPIYKRMPQEFYFD